MTTITQDDVAAFEDVLRAIDQADEDVRDLAERMKRKGDLDRVARRKVQEQLR